MKLIILLLCSLSFVAQVSAGEVQEEPRVNIIKILESYSNRTGTKFVTDPRVKAKVRLIGLKLNEIDQIGLNKILLLHSFVAYEKSGVVYVIPRVIEEQYGKQIGTKWE